MNGKKILIVDDNDKSRKLMRVIFQKSGYATVEAKNGKEGIETARMERPHLILMDVRMPVMDGIMATRALKDDPATKDIPVIITTSSAMKGDHDKIASEARCDYYITKPLDIQSLLDMAKKILGGKET
ncbi:MAG: response regulator [Deltaproteobacteria bacterium]|nr:response regulator [Deltaproteobacteria bacterium]